MARESLLDTSTASWAALVGNGRRLVVPPFQRDYAWDLEDWEDLWLDLAELRLPGALSHYMGTVVLQPRGEKVFWLIDGQQRLTTLSLLALAVISRLTTLSRAGHDAQQNRERADLLKERLLGSKDASSLVHTWKIRLNRHCNDFYHSYLLAQQLPPARAGLSEPEAQMLGAFRFFEDRLAEDARLATDGQELAFFLENVVASKTLFIEVKVEDEVSAYTVFETLNARGTELTPTDLLKNYLFSLVQPGDEPTLEYLEARWERTGQLVGLRAMPEFVRHYVNSTRNLVREDRLFKELKLRITTADEVLRFLPQLESEAAVYVALKDPDHELWEGDSRLHEALDMLDLLSIKQTLSLLLAAYRGLGIQDLGSVARSVAIFTLRFSTVGRRRNSEIEPLFNRIAVALHNGEIRNPSGVRKALAELCPVDAQFEADFMNFGLALSGPKKKLAKYMLLQLEAEHSGAPVTMDPGKATVEHILPQSQSNQGNAQLVSRLGNLTLLEKLLNREAGGKPFTAKVPIYAKSVYQLTRELTGESWGEAEILARQKHLAELACRRWRL